MLIYCQKNIILFFWLIFGYPCGPGFFLYNGDIGLKDFKTYDEQIDLLKNRWLIINDKSIERIKVVSIET